MNAPDSHVTMSSSAIKKTSFLPGFEPPYSDFSSLPSLSSLAAASGGKKMLLKVSSDPTSI